jgi:acyl-CoA synthetase (AMP-forming)/AMP-acid ligase II
MGGIPFKPMGPGYSLAEVFSAVAQAVPEREALTCEGATLSYGELLVRARSFASALIGLGLGKVRERSELAPWESGQDHLGICAYNCLEYVECMLGSYLARVAPFNINYRYVAKELEYLLGYLKPAALCYEPAFAGELGKALEALARDAGTSRPRLIEFGPGNSLLGAVSYEELVKGHRGHKSSLDVEPSPDDLYILCTGGTTGLPKATLWRQADIHVAALGGIPGHRLEEIAAAARAASPVTVLVVPPLMHGAAQWVTLRTLFSGSHVVLYREDKGLRADAVLELAERHRALMMLIVGDAFLRPLLDELETYPGRYDLSGLKVVLTGGAFTSEALKARLLELLPGLTIVDVGGASETGSQIVNVSSVGRVTGAEFDPEPTTVIVDESFSRFLEPGEEGVGWLAKKDFIPLGYLGDREKTERTFRVVEGVRVAVPGDRARYVGKDKIRLLGRDSVTINSGGEKIFAEEVEQAIASHPGVADVVVVGVSSPRWGQEVVALVVPRKGARLSDEELIAHASRSIARYKLPKKILFVESVERSPAGKPDYRWARQKAEAILGLGRDQGGS